MKMEFKKDLHHNYMVISEIDNNLVVPYCIKMLSFITWEGMLSFARRMMDNQEFYYYDISGKQSLHTLFDKSILSYERIKCLFLSIINIIEKAYEYLLMEDDFMLSPEGIYMDVVTDTPYLCYISGYRKNIKEQISSLIEYIMNKVNYNDKEAVLLIYSLYSISKEDGFTFQHLREVLLKQPDLMIGKKKEMKHGINSDIDKKESNDFRKAGETGMKPGKTLHFEKELPEKEVREPDHTKERKSEKKILIPVMKEKVTEEKEVDCYPVKTFVYTALCVIGGLLVIAAAMFTKVIFNTFGNRIDYSKLFALLLIITCVEGYLLRKLWDRKNRITKIVTTNNYMNPMDIEKDINVSSPSFEKKNYYRVKESEEFKDSIEKKDNLEKDSNKNSNKNTTGGSQETNQKLWEEGDKEDKIDEDGYNPTCILNEELKSPSYLLKPYDPDQYETITMSQFPFFIGKLKKNVDYCLENDVVSRYHAKITKELDGYYIIDLNSTNGTFLNSESLLTYQKKALKPGDEIAFANIKYQFVVQ